MFHLHIGMPKTGTTALQRLLAGSSTLLEERGFSYPERWRNQENLAHHALGQEFLDADAQHLMRAEVLEYLRQHKDRHVLISSESFTNALTNTRFPALYEFLCACSEVMPVKVLCSLRRIDSFFTSMYLHDQKIAGWRESIDQYIEHRFAWIDQFFEKLRQLSLAREAGSLELVPYREGHDAITTLLARCGLPQLVSANRQPPRENTRLGLRAQSFMAFFGELTAGSSLATNKAAAIRLLESGRFKFSGEIEEYDILDFYERRCIHEYALRKALEVGVRPYFDAFADARIRRFPAKCVLSRDLVDLGEVRRLEEAASQPVRHVSLSAPR